MSLARFHAPSSSRQKGRLVAVNEAGLPIGQDHQRAKLTDAQVDEIRELRESRRWKIPALARKFGVSVSTIHGIVTYSSRAQTPVGYRRIRAAQRSVA